MAEVVLQARRRTVFGKQVKHLRSQGTIPANVNVKLQPSLAIQVEAREFEGFLKAHGVTTLITLEIDETTGTDGTGGTEGKRTTSRRTARPTRRAALLGEVQRAAVSGQIQHIEFQQVNLNEPVHAHAPIVLAGEAPAVRTLGGVLLRPLSSVEVSALPRDLPEAITLDISSLTELNSSLFVRDLTLPDNVTLLTDPDEPVVTVQAPRMAVEEAPAAEAAETPAQTATPAVNEQPSNEG